MMSTRSGALVFAALFCASSIWAFTIEMVPVGNPGKVADPTIMSDATTGHGSVGYKYRIGKYEVTAGEYTEILNAVADADPTNILLYTWATTTEL